MSQDKIDEFAVSGLLRDLPAGIVSLAIGAIFIFGVIQLVLAVVY